METIDYLKELANNRIKLARVKAEVKDLETDLEQTDAFRKLESHREVLRILEAHVNGLESGIKNRVETEFVRAGLKNNKPYDGVQVKKFQVVHILSEREAMRWASENAPGALSIKTAQFNKIAKAVDLDFVNISTEWRAQIASDLSMYEDNTGNTASTASE